MRPANIVTSVADVMAGCAMAGIFSAQQFPGELSRIVLLCFSTACLYGGGVVFNDVFDAELDKVERPERAIPRGLISIAQASTLGGILLSGGILTAFYCGSIPGLLAAGIAFFALLYNRVSKNYAFFGPLNMGLCRGLNLLLGVSILVQQLHQLYFLAIVPVVYIFSITLISRGEVHGSGKGNLYIASGFYGIVTGFILYYAFLNSRLWYSVIFLVPFLWMIFAPLLKAIQNPIGKNIGGAVKAGVISLILMDAAWAATFSSLYVAVIIACLLPVSIWLSKIFAVT